MTSKGQSLLNNDYELSTDQVKFFKNAGHIHLRSVISADELDKYNPHFRGALRSYFDLTAEKGSSGNADDFGSDFARITNLWQKNPGVRSFVFAARFARIAAGLLQSDSIRLYNDQGLYKEPGGLVTPWQQNLYFMPLNTEDVVTMWIPLTDLSDGMGSLSFVSTSHRYGNLGLRDDSSDTKDHYEELIRRTRLETVNYNLRAGDALFFYGWTLYSSDPNNSSRLREALAITYYADGAEIIEPDNPFRQKHYNLLFRNNKPGDLASGELNPVLFSRR